jgi:hypothetical protein
MANTIKEHKIIDSNKRALLKYVFLSDGTAEANTLLVDASNLRFALNANGYIMSSNTHPKTNYRTTIKRIYGTAKSNGYISLKWQGDTNSEIAIISDGGFDYNFESMGDGAVINNPEANATGDIIISTNANKTGDAFTLFIDLRKDGRDYDSGQTADPYAFNKVT